MKDRLIIGSRGSKLALWQAEWVRKRLNELHPRTQVSIEIIKTSGDVQKNAPLSVIGGKGVFTKELEEALLDGRIDLAVHSLKDLPTILPEGLTIAAISAREDARDALVLREGLSINQLSIRNLPEGCVVGTSSPRRLSQLKHLRPQLVIKELRGNVDTRLRKLDAGEYDAVILASAGLRRLGLAHRISAPLEIEEMLPAVGQGALAVETRSSDEETGSLLASLDDEPTRAACTSERALLRALGGGCQLPIAAHAIFQQGRLRLYGLVAAISGETIIRDSLEGAASAAEKLGSELALRLREHGAESLLAESAR
ncbi:MAG: hydroxymethylbilane synthase [Acidobacteriota bacterium]|jgi:hydroxymethylbilane synthase|nr:hydroxymethylbilane synthase [Acidobacteriota bacterium]